MRILFVGAADWANSSHRVARAINVVTGKESARVLTMFSTGSHQAHEAPKYDWDDISVWTQKVDWIISTGDGAYLYLNAVTQSLPFPSTACLGAAHVGSAYRMDPIGFNKIDKENGFKIRFIGGDLYRFAADDPIAVPYFCPPTEVVEVLPPLSGEVRVGHAARSTTVKGSHIIRSALLDLPVESDLMTGLPFDECQQRRKKCHIYVDQINDLGGYGAAAVEALAAGCATLSSTTSIHLKVRDFYPPAPIVEVTAASLRECVQDLIGTPNKLQSIRKASLAWAQRYATPEAVGRYWLKHLEAAR